MSTIHIRSKCSLSWGYDKDLFFFFKSTLICRFPERCWRRGRACKQKRGHKRWDKIVGEFRGWVSHLQGKSRMFQRGWNQAWKQMSLPQVGEDGRGLGHWQSPPHQATPTTPGAKITPLIRARDPAIVSDRKMQLLGTRNKKLKLLDVWKAKMAYVWWNL